MRRINRCKSTVACMASVLCATIASWVSAAEPAVVVELKDVNSLVTSVNVAMKALEQEAPPPAMITGALGGMLNAPGLAGIDAAKPARLYLFLPGETPAGETPDPMAMVPRMAYVLPVQGDGSVYSSAIASMLPNSTMIGNVKRLYNAGMPGQDTYLAKAGSRVVVGSDLQTVKDVLRIVGRQAADKSCVDARGTVRAKLNVPACIPFVEQMMDMARAQVSTAPVTPEMPMDPGKIITAEAEALLSLMHELESYSLGIEISSDAVTIYDRITPRAGSKTATWISGLKRPAERYMKVLPEDCMMASVGSGMNVIDQIAEPYGELVENIYQAMGEPMSKLAKPMNEMMRDMKGVYAGDIAMGVVQTADGKGMGFVEVAALSNQSKAREMIEKSIKMFSQDGELMPGLTLKAHPVRKHNGVEVHGYSYGITAATNMPANPAVQMEWLDGLKWEMAFVGKDLVYTLGDEEIMNSTLERLRNPRLGKSLDKSSAFATTFPQPASGVIEVHTLSISRLLTSVSQLLGADTEAMSALSKDAPALAGYSVTRGGCLLGIDSISMNEIKAIMGIAQGVVNSLQGLIGAGAAGAAGAPHGVEHVTIPHPMPVDGAVTPIAK